MYYFFILVLTPYRTNKKVDIALHNAAQILHKTRKCNSAEERCMTKFINNFVFKIN